MASPANLNSGDCFVDSPAQVIGEPLRFVTPALLP